jgi:hypothetical protein
VISLTKKAQDVPDVEPTNALAAGAVFVMDCDGGKLTQVVEKDQRVVLEVAGKKLELTTADATGATGGPASYVSAADGAALGGNPAKMRLYGGRDRWRKSRSLPGLLVWAPAFVGAFLAFAGVIFLGAKSPIDPSTVADTAKDVQAWVLKPPAGAPPSATARLVVAERCLDGLAGRPISPDIKIPGVKCTPNKPSWFKNQDHAALVTAVGGVITTVLGAIGALRKLRFGSTP